PWKGRWFWDWLPGRILRVGTNRDALTSPREAVPDLTHLARWACRRRSKACGAATRWTVDAVLLPAKAPAQKRPYLFHRACACRSCNKGRSDGRRGCGSRGGKSKFGVRSLERRGVERKALGRANQ